MQQNERIFEFRDHLVRIGDEVRRQVATIELHTFDNIEFGFERLGFFNRDDAFIADFRHGFGDHCANFGVAVCRDRADLGNLFVRLHLLGMMSEVFNDFGGCLVDAALQVHWVHAGSNALQAFANDGLGENRCGRGAVTGNVVGLGSHFAQHLCAHVFQLVFKLDLFCDGDAVLRGARSAEGFLDDDVTAFWTERDFNGVGKRIDAFQHPFASFCAENYVFG